MSEFDDDIVAYIESSSGKESYAIRSTLGGGLTCECLGFKWRGNCKHLKAFKEKSEVVLKVRLIFTDKRGGEVIVLGEEVDIKNLRTGDVTTRLGETEEFLSRLMGKMVRVTTETL